MILEHEEFEFVRTNRDGFSMRRLFFLWVSFVILTSLWTSTGTHYSFDESPLKVIVPADDFHRSETVTVGIYYHDYLTWSLSYHNGIYGNFEVTYPASGDDQIITFFICDQENYDLWIGGEDSEKYHHQTNVADYSFEFIVPSEDTWYFVFTNYALFTHKTVDVNLYRDDTPPAISMNLNAGATYSSLKVITATITEATFAISSVSLYIDGALKDTETDSSFSYSWNTKGYSNGAHTVRISASDNVGNTGYREVIVYVSNVIPTSTTTDTTQTTTIGGTIPPLASDTTLNRLYMLGGIGLIATYGIAIVLRKRDNSVAS